MNRRDDSFMEELLATFKVEAREHLTAISAGLIEMEQHPAGEHRATTLETIYREAHSLKGAARAVSLTGIESICQALESVLSAWKRGALELQPGQFDILYRTLDAVGDSLIPGQRPPPETLAPELMTLTAAAPDGASAASGPAGGTDHTATPPPQTVAAPEPVATLRIATDKLDALFLQAEEMLSVKQAARQRVDDLKDLLSVCESGQRRWEHTAAGAFQIARPAPAGHGETSETPLGFIRALGERLALLASQMDEDQRTTDRMVDALLDGAKGVLMLPAATALQGFPRMVRDLCRSQDKQVELTMTGGELEIDKRILEEIKVPLTHLLRNSVDHGIETAPARMHQGKPACGRITLALTRADSRTVRICVSDDGAGIDPAPVKAAAVRQGVLSPAAADRLSDAAALGLVFMSSVSTSPSVNELSGRGLGLSIAREKVERLGGRISFETKPGAGTTFQILLPLTLATFRGILVESAEQRLIIPTASVDRVIRVRAEDLCPVEGRDTIQVEGRTLVFARLEAVLGQARGSRSPAEHTRGFPTLLISLADRHIAFGVDRILGEQEGLVKTLGQQLQRVRNVTGATLLGTGELVPILDPAGLFQSAAMLAAAPTPAATNALSPAPGPRRKAVLLAEDSIASRMLLKNILEAAGYAVTACVDGAAAWSLLKTRDFDAIVSDIEMPRLDGFALTTQIRADPALVNLPVILVTAHEAREDQERGIDAGANAYLIKSSFEQSDLLSTLGRLI